MKRIQYHRYGGPQELRLAVVAMSEPAGDQIRVRVRAASVNQVDWKLRAGVLKIITGSRFPRGVGQDFAGVVEAVGPTARRFRVGDEVFGTMELKEAASFAETLVTSENTAALKPPALSFEVAGTLATVGRAAWGALADVGKLQAGQRLFVNGCLGSVGRCAVQLGRGIGAEVDGTCSGTGFAEARQLGVGTAVDYHGFDPKTFRGRFDRVLDTVGNLSTGQCAGMLRRGGVALHINAGLAKILCILLAPHNKLAYVKTTPEILAKIGDAAAQGKLVLPIAETVPLSQAIAAITELEQQGTPKGKVVIVPA